MQADPDDAGDPPLLPPTFALEDPDEAELQSQLELLLTAAEPTQRLVPDSPEQPGHAWAGAAEPREQPPPPASLPGDAGQAACAAAEVAQPPGRLPSDASASEAGSQQPGDAGQLQGQQPAGPPAAVAGSAGAPGSAAGGTAADGQRSSCRETSSSGRTGCTDDPSSDVTARGGEAPPLEELTQLTQACPAWHHQGAAGCAAQTGTQGADAKWWHRLS